MLELDFVKGIALFPGNQRLERAAGETLFPRKVRNGGVGGQGVTGG